MDHYYYTNRLGQLWTEAVRKYQAGKRGADTYFDSAQVAFLHSIGLGVMDVYDYAEDYTNGSEPDFPTFVAIHDIRRAYFLEVQRGIPSTHRLHVDELPPKEASVAGLAWLPRLLPKARAKLRGEMPPEIMYGCGGDRRFFRDHNIHPAEFLRLVWLHGDADQPVIDWVLARRP